MCALPQLLTALLCHFCLAAFNEIRKYIVCWKIEIFEVFLASEKFKKRE